MGMRLSSRWSKLVVAASCTLLSVVGIRVTDALAQPATSASPSNEARARQLADEAKAAFDAGRFEDAVDLLNKAHALKPEPTLLYNIARAEQQAGRLVEAVAAYRRYLNATSSKSSDRGFVERTIQELERRIEESERIRLLGVARSHQLEGNSAKAIAVYEQVLKMPSLPPDERANVERALRELHGNNSNNDKPVEPTIKGEAAPSPSPSQPSPGSRLLLPVATGALGLVTLGAALFVSGAANERRDEAAADPNANSAFAKEEDAKTLAGIATGLTIAGSVIGAVGVGWTIFTLTRPTTNATTKATVNVRSASLLLRAAF